ncbi:glucose PTS transporter subunit EIIB [Cellulomonas sp. NPDC057328]|uniref:glucose PTS transporter subunit EIIB n=1 Tax=Cellulomonas sp. NPDC057328 TaxID=3346101 RepID=UPI00362EFF89
MPVTTDVLPTRASSLLTAVRRPAGGARVRRRTAPTAASVRGQSVADGPRRASADTRAAPPQGRRTTRRGAAPRTKDRTGGCTPGDGGSLGQHARDVRPRRGGARDVRHATTRGENHLSKAQQILAALGGETNVVDLEPCITRLRVEVGDAELVDEAALKASGAFGVVRSGHVVQVIVGPEADNLAAELDTLR